ncbi:MAG: hypothetical protein ABG776_20855, partial [Cyanobacteria bacterium J06555_13]
PVSVSCLERYESETLSKYKQSWINRWQVLEDFRDELCSSHVAIHDDSEVDITCPRKLHTWLLKQDAAKASTRQVAGMAFYAPYKGLDRVFRNLVINGLPIVFWPKHVINKAGIESLQKSLKVTPSSTLASMNNYRVTHSQDAAGPISILVDNPYLPPPDCEIDYY